MSACSRDKADNMTLDSLDVTPCVSAPPNCAASSFPTTRGPCGHSWGWTLCLADDPWNYGPFDGPTLQPARWGWCLPQAWCSCWHWLQLFTLLSRSAAASASGVSLGVEGHTEVHSWLPSILSVFLFFFYDNSNQPYASFSNSSGTPNRVTIWKPVQTCPLALFSPERGQLLASIIEKKNHFDVSFSFLEKL